VALFPDGRIAAGDASESVSDLVARNHPDGLEAEGESTPMWADPNFGSHSIHTYGAHFAEVGVDADTGEIRLRQMLGVFSPGRVLNDGRRATTHWRYAARLQREYPSIRVEADRIFCRDGNVWTSAGITAGIDLALALIEEDHGFAIAKGVAQQLVVYHRRYGGQSQFAASIDLAPKNDRIAAAVGYARDHIAEVVTVERLAEAVGMSLRQFSRAFRAQTGTTPARVVERLRADLARGRIETTAEPVERIAEAVGFGEAENMRRAFIRIYGQPPQSIRRAIRS
jgi:transcriptional regulator GlxA family with amidase domain